MDCLLTEYAVHCSANWEAIIALVAGVIIAGCAIFDRGGRTESKGPR